MVRLCFAILAQCAERMSGIFLLIRLYLLDVRRVRQSSRYGISSAARWTRTSMVNQKLSRSSKCTIHVCLCTLQCRSHLLILFDDHLGCLFGNAIHERLQMSTGEQRDDTSIYDPQALEAVDLQVGVHDAAVLLR